MELKSAKLEIRENGIGILTLTRPESLNSISTQFVEDINIILDYLILIVA